MTMPCPEFADIRMLTAAMPALNDVIVSRWREGHACSAAGCHTACEIMMGSVLEGLLLGRALLSPEEALASSAAPATRQIRNWHLSALIDVAIERRWVRGSMKGCSHVLRRYRNAVHPWEQATAAMPFDAKTYRSCTKLLRVIVSDLVVSCAVQPPAVLRETTSAAARSAGERGWKTKSPGRAERACVGCAGNAKPPGARHGPV
jgi:hypothetical protein